jgi:hypothetical protein
MAYSVQDILGSINKSGWLPSNKFQVMLNLPYSLQGSIDNLLLTFRAEDCRLPGVSYMASDVNRYGVGPLQKMPYNVMFTDTSISFISDKNGSIYNCFYTWMNTIFNFSDLNKKNGSYETEYKDNYTTDISITVYDNNGNQVQIVKFLDAFPISMNEIPLSWNQNSQLLKVTVGFSFREWTLESLNIQAQPSARVPQPQPQPQTPIPSTPPEATQ